MIVDIIVAVYRDTALTRRCIESVLNAEQRTAYELVVIDVKGQHRRGNLRADDGDTPINERIVGGLKMPGVEPVKKAGDDRDNQHC